MSKALPLRPKYRLIPLSRGKFVKVSPQDFNFLNLYKWHCLITGYAARTRTQPERKLIYLHREVIGAKKGEVVDHINRNRLDCRRENLRIVTASQNRLNSPATTKSGYKGVYQRNKRWAVILKQSGRVYCFGYFSDIESALIARDKAFQKLWGANWI